MYGIFGFLHVVVLSVLIWFSFPFFVWMFIFWGEWKSTGNKSSLIESFPSLFFYIFVLTCALVPTLSLYFFFFSPPCSGKTSPRLLPYNLYHLTNMSKDIFLSFPWTFVPCLSPPLCHIKALSPLPILRAVPWFWWQGSSFQLGRWVSNQSGLSRGASDCRTHSLIASRQAGEQLQSLQHMLTRAGAAVLAAPPPKACKSLS